MGSAASLARFENLDAGCLLCAEVLHLTRIAPQLSESCRDLVGHLARKANEDGIFVSFDANIRFGILKDRAPCGILLPLIERADLLFFSEEEAKLLLGSKNPESVRRFADDLRANTIVVHGAQRAFVVLAGGLFEKSAYPAGIMDTVGANDAFVAGFLSGRSQG